MLTNNPDDTVGLLKAYEAIVKGENIAEPSIPESFKVLLKEMQSLALDVRVVSDEGQQAEVGDEEDDLLRAAEELGLDLSGVRSPGAPAADEAIDGAEADDGAETDESPEADAGADAEDEDADDDGDEVTDLIAEGEIELDGLGEDEIEADGLADTADAEEIQ